MKKSTKKFQPDLGMTQGAGCGVGGRRGDRGGVFGKSFPAVGQKQKEGGARVCGGGLRRRRMGAKGSPEY